MKEPGQTRDFTLVAAGDLLLPEVFPSDLTLDPAVCRVMGHGDLTVANLEVPLTDRTESIGKFIAIHPKVLLEVRGLGLMIGVELAEGIAAFAESKRPASVQIVERLHAAGLLTIPAGARVFRLLPPLNISKQDADEGLAIIESVIKELAS